MLTVGYESVIDFKSYIRPSRICVKADNKNVRHGNDLVRKVLFAFPTKSSVERSREEILTQISHLSIYVNVVMKAPANYFQKP